jgi:nucleotide-binding universal stress UspA family protein
MSVSTRPTIVVGVNGSSASARALGWAAAEADRMDARLKIVLIWSIGPRAYYAPTISPGDYDRRQEHAAGRLAATMRAVLDSMPRDSVMTMVAEGTPERALVEQSADADLLVLGSASGVTSGRSVGPVIRTCLSHAHCPVVVVGPDCASDRTRVAATSQHQGDLQLAAAAPAASGLNGRL